MLKNTKYFSLPEGVGDSMPEGTTWVMYNGELDVVVLSEHIDQLWGINSVGYLYYRPGVTVASPSGSKCATSHLSVNLAEPFRVTR